MIREVSFISRHLAQTTVSWGREGIISITSARSGKVRLRKGWRRVLRLKFDDVERASPGCVAFDEDHADAIFDWLGRVEDHVDRIFVHCNAGKHRSPAVALFIAEIYDLPGFNRTYPLYNRRVYRVMGKVWKKRNRLKPALHMPV